MGRKNMQEETRSHVENDTPEEQMGRDLPPEQVEQAGRTGRKNRIEYEGESFSSDRIVDDVFNAVDAEGRGGISYDAFESWWMSRQTALERPAQLGDGAETLARVRKVWYELDNDDDGLIDRTDFMRILSETIKFEWDHRSTRDGQMHFVHRQARVSTPVAPGHEAHIAAWLAEHCGLVNSESTNSTDIFEVDNPLYSGNDTKSTTTTDVPCTFYTDAMVKYPCVMLLLFLIAPVCATVVALSQPLELQTDIWNAFKLRKSHFAVQREEVFAATNFSQYPVNYSQHGLRRQLQMNSSQAVSDFVDETSEIIILFMYYEDGRNMLTPSGISMANKVEKSIEDFDGYSGFCVSHHCVAQAHWPCQSWQVDVVYDCEAPLSITNSFFPSTASNSTRSNSQMIYDGRGPVLVDFEDVLLRLFNNRSSTSELKWFLDNSGESERESSYLSTQFTFLFDRAKSDEYLQWQGLLLQYIESLNTYSPSDEAFRVVYGGKGKVMEYLIQQQIEEDLAYAAYSLLMVFLYSVWHTKSVLLTIGTLVMIGLTLPAAYFFYFSFLAIDGNAAVGILNVIGVYVILGIGVDDVYVFLAAFKQCGLDSHTLEHQLARAHRSAAKATLLTSATAIVAFLSLSLSEIPVILSFAKFMATLVIVNYVFVITIFPVSCSCN